MPIHAAAFSSDATIVALAHGAVVTLWDVDSNILLKVLEDASVSDAHKVAFVGPEGQYLVAAGKRSGIAVWDLLSCGGGPSTLAKKNTDVYVIVLWASSSTRCDKLLSHTSRLLFISSSTDGRNRSLVTVFSPSDPKHLRQYQVQPELSDICSLPSSAPVDTDRIQFIGIVKNGEVYRFGGAVSSSAPKTDRVAGQPGTKKPLSIWQEMFGKDAFLEDLETAPGTIPPPRASKVGRPSEVFDGPSHTMPPVGSLFDAFMEELLSVKTSGAMEDDAMATDQIIYEEPNSAPALPMPAVEESRTRPVTDEEVRDLTAFFRETLASSTFT